MREKVIVTGGAGFIGSHLVELLVKKNYKVIVIDNFETGRKENLKLNKKTNLEVFRADISDYSKIYKKFKNVKYVFI